MHLVSLYMLLGIVCALLLLRGLNFELETDTFDRETANSQVENANSQGETANSEIDAVAAAALCGKRAKRAFLILQPYAGNARNAPSLHWNLMRDTRIFKTGIVIHKTRGYRSQLGMFFCRQTRFGGTPIVLHALRYRWGYRSGYRPPKWVSFLEVKTVTHNV